MAVTCDHCGTVTAGEEPPLGWSLSVEGRRAHRYCERCTRHHLRSMEGKLDREHW